MADEYESYLGSLTKFQDYSECLGPGQGCVYRLLEKLGCVTFFTLKSRICWFRREKRQGLTVTHKLHFHRRNSSHPVLFQTWRTSTEQRPQPETDNLSACSVHTRGQSSARPGSPERQMSEVTTGSQVSAGKQLTKTPRVGPSSGGLGRRQVRGNSTGPWRINLSTKTKCRLPLQSSRFPEVHIYKLIFTVNPLWE